jgi:oligosaccharide repeat unit polymerase
MNRLWWCKPHALLAFFIIPLYVLIVYRLYHIEFTQSGQKPILSIEAFTLGFLSLVILLCGIFFGILLATNKNKNTIEIKKIDMPLRILAVLAFFAYVIWFLPVFLNFDLMLSLLTGTPGANTYVRNNYSTIPGVTTLVQLSVVYSALYGAYRARLPSIHDKIFYMLFFLALWRSFVWSERLAIIEFLMPFVICRFSIYNINRFRIVFNILPFFGVIGLIFYFVLFEYNRSWISYYSDIYDSLWLFGVDRFLEYYFMAINNSVGVMVYIGWPTYEPFSSLGFVFDFPVVGAHLKSLFGMTTSDVGLYLYSYGEEEFNNTSGTLLPIIEFGYFSYVLTAILGSVIGYLYGSSATNKFYLALYSVFVVGILEILRLPYYGEGRFFAVMLGFLLFYFLSKGLKYAD